MLQIKIHSSVIKSVFRFGVGITNQISHTSGFTDTLLWIIEKFRGTPEVRMDKPRQGFNITPVLIVSGDARTATLAVKGYIELCFSVGHGSLRVTQCSRTNNKIYSLRIWVLHGDKVVKWMIWRQCVEVLLIRNTSLPHTSPFSLNWL